MKNLEDIPKKNVFDVPEGYFDQLPGIIQARVAGSQRESLWAPYLRISLKYALPVLAIIVVSFFFWTKPAGQSAEDLLASVDSGSLVAFLEDSDISSDDLLEGINLNREEADAIQNDSIEELQVDDNDIKKLTDEFGVDYF